MKYKSYLVVLLTIAIFYSCGSSFYKKTKKIWNDTFSSTSFISRSYHQTKTLYNILFHAQDSYDKALYLLEQNTTNDFFSVLKMEYIEPFDTLKKYPSKVIEVPFLIKKTIIKTTKAIQKHSIKKGLLECNKYIDDAYILLGKSQYYLKNYISAIETFDYVKDNFKNSDSYYQSVLWSAKTNIRLSNEYLIEEDLENLYKNLEKIDDDTKKGILNVYAQVLINRGKNLEAIKVIKKLFNYNLNNKLKTRYSFILAHLYSLQKEYKKSNFYFDKVIQLDDEQDFVIYSKVGKLNNLLDIGRGKPEEYINKVKQLLKDKSNKNYYGFINYSLGNYYLKKNQIERAKVFFIKASKSKMIAQMIKVLCFERLGDIYFDLGIYDKSKNSYTTCISNAPKNWKNLHLIMKKINSLNDVAKYLKICGEKDSILNLVQMSKEDRIKYFQRTLPNYEDLIFKNRKEINDENNRSFYFYNKKSFAYGKKEFEKIWKNRILQSIERNNTVIKQIKKERNEAYYRLAIIYYTKYKKVELAIQTFEKLLSYKPDKNFTILIYYNLYKIYKEQQNYKSEGYKNKILKLAPNSVYVDLINNKTITKKQIYRSQIEYEYQSTYNLYIDNNYKRVIKKCNKNIEFFIMEEMVVKFYLLKAMSFGKLGNKSKYEECLSIIIENFPKSNEAKRAKEILQRLK